MSDLYETDPRGLRLTEGHRLGPSGTAQEEVILRAGRFSDERDAADLVLSVAGHWVLPGIVDLHGDAFEHSLAPRRGMVTDLSRGLDAVEAELALNGITTAWLAQFWSWEGGMRGPEFARRLAVALAETRASRRIDMRMQLRFENHMVEDGAAIRALVADHGIDYVVFNDHLPHDHLAGGRTPPRLTGAALKAGRSPGAHLAEMERLHANRAEVSGFVADLATVFAAEGVHLGSHDEPDAEIRAVWAALGLTISEFPTTRDAAKAAKAQGAPVIMGAPNVLRGGSHDGRVAAEDLIADGLVTALASDYHYPALVGAAFKLADRGALPFADAWKLVSSGPAAMMGLSDRGSLDTGKRADLVLIDPETRRVAGVFSAGRPVFLMGRLLERFLRA